MENETLLVEKKDGIVLITVNRPKALNSLNSLLLAELMQTFNALSTDETAKVIILTGSGEKAFIAGADIAEMVNYNPQQALAFARLGQQLVNCIGHLAKPVIAAVNGFALGGGLEMALACDFIYAAENARFGFPETALGIMPGFGGTQKFARLIGRNRANELIFTGRLLSAAEAKEWGVVNALFSAGELIANVMDAATKIAGKGLIAVAHAKQAIKGGLDMAEADGIDYEAALFAALFGTADQKEGMQAFIDKRKPVFIGA